MNDERFFSRFLSLLLQGERERETYLRGSSMKNGRASPINGPIGLVSIFWPIPGG